MQAVANVTLWRRRMLPYCSDDNFRDLSAPAAFTEQGEPLGEGFGALPFKSERQV